jgi:hypothetical protein
MAIFILAFECDKNPYPPELPLSTLSTARGQAVALPSGCLCGPRWTRHGALLPWERQLCGCSGPAGHLATSRYISLHLVMFRCISR